MYIKLFLAFILSIAYPISSHAQSFDNTMRSNGRIYVVVTVIAIIFLGVFIYMLRLDRKLKKLEQQQRSESHKLT